MTDRDPLRAIQQRQRRDIFGLYRTLDDAIQNAVDRLPGERDRPITEADRVAIMREVDRSLGVLWGAGGAVEQIVTRDTRAARLVPLEAAVRRWKRAVPRSLWERIEGEARDGR